MANEQVKDPQYSLREMQIKTTRKCYAVTMTILAKNMQITNADKNTEKIECAHKLLLEM